MFFVFLKLEIFGSYKRKSHKTSWAVLARVGALGKWAVCYGLQRKANHPSTLRTHIRPNLSCQLASPTCYWTVGEKPHRRRENLQTPRPSCLEGWGMGGGCIWKMLKPAALFRWLIKCYSTSMQGPKKKHPNLITDTTCCLQKPRDWMMDILTISCWFIYQRRRFRLLLSGPGARRAEGPSFFSPHRGITLMSRIAGVCLMDSWCFSSGCPWCCRYIHYSQVARLCLAPSLKRGAVIIAARQFISICFRCLKSPSWWIRCLRGECWGSLGRLLWSGPSGSTSASSSLALASQTFWSTTAALKPSFVAVS